MTDDRSVQWKWPVVVGRAQAASVMPVWEGESETDFQGGLDELSELRRAELKGKTNENFLFTSSEDLWGCSEFLAS